MSIIYTLSHPLTNEIRYVGYTSKSLNERLRRHIDRAKNSSNNYHCLQWIRNLLNSNLIPEINLLEECDVNNWQNAEKYWIAQLKCWGFNLINYAEGGNGNPFLCQGSKNKISENNKNRKLTECTKNKISQSHLGKKHSEKTKEKLKGLHTGLNHYLYGKNLSEEVKKKISNSKKGKKLTEDHKKKLSNSLKGVNHPMYGQKHSDETIQKISLANKGKLHTDITKKKISDSIKGINNPRYGVKLSNELKEKIKKSAPSKPVIKLSKTGEIIEEFISCKEAFRATGVDCSSISKCCSGKVKTAGGFIWNFKYKRMI